MRHRKQIPHARPRGISVPFIALLTCLGLFFPAAAFADEESGPTLTISPGTTVAYYEDVTFSSTGWQAGEQVTVEYSFDGSPWQVFGQPTADADGALVPENFSFNPGVLDLRLTGDETVITGTVTIVGPSVTAGPEPIRSHEEYTISGTGWRPGADLDVVVFQNGEVVWERSMSEYAQGVVDADGTFALTFTEYGASELSGSFTDPDFGVTEYVAYTVHPSDAAAGVIDYIEVFGCRVDVTVTTVGVEETRLVVSPYGGAEELLLTTWQPDGERLTRTESWFITYPAGEVGIFLFEVGASFLDRVDPWAYPEGLGESCAAVLDGEALLEAPDQVWEDTEFPLRGSGFLPGEDVEITGLGEDGDSEVVIADESGDIEYLAFPRPVGSEYTIAAIGLTSDLVAEVDVEVLQPPTIDEVHVLGCTIEVDVTVYAAAPSGYWGFWSYPLDGDIHNIPWTPNEGQQTLAWVIDQAGGDELMAWVNVPAYDNYVVADGFDFTVPTGLSEVCAADAATISGPEEALPGETFEVAGDGWLPGEDIEIWLNSDSVLLTTLTADANGQVGGAVTVPADTALGAHTLRAVAAVTELEATNALSVVAAEAESGAGAGGSATGTGGVLPHTGAGDEVLVLLFMGLCLMLLGGVAVRRGRP